MDAKTKLLSFKKELDPLIHDFFDRYLDDHPDLSEDAVESVELIRDFTCRGGKRLRAALVFYGYLLLGGKDKEKIRKVSISIELFQSYILMVDDYMDRADMRRGGLTPHTYYEQKHDKLYTRGERKFYGASMGLTTSLIADQLAHISLQQSGLSDNELADAVRVISKNIAYTGFGQLLDVQAEVKDTMTEEDAIKVCEWKSACYTYLLPLHLGAMLAGAREADLEKLSAYAIPGGIAFQLQDDILGLYGNEEKFGKPVWTDISEGKLTLLMVKAFELAKPDEVTRLKNILGTTDLTQKQLEDVRAIVKDCGAYDYVVEKAQAYVLDSQKALKNMKGWNKEGLDFLEGIAEYMINRDV